MSCIELVIHEKMNLERIPFRQQYRVSITTNNYILLFFLNGDIYMFSKFIDLETIPTSRGKKLMLSGLWGHVRHPNYLGDLIIQWSIAIISLRSDILPYYSAICCTLMLAYRAVRDNRRCQTRYGYAWEQYCSRVKYMILKHIF